MVRKIRSIKKMLNYNDSYADILDIIGQENDFSDEDIAIYANMNIDTVKSIKEKWANEEFYNPFKK